MPMGRYLCQLCWSIVHYGERHPCFFYKDEDEVYTLPQTNKLEEEEEKHEETHSGNWNDNNLHISAAAQANHDEDSKQRNSHVIENYERISLVPASGTKRRGFSMFPSFRGITSTNMYSESASNTSIERDAHKDGEKKSKVQRKRKRVSAEATQRVDFSSIGMATCSSALGSVAHGEAENVEGPSRIRTRSLGSESERASVCDVCGRGFTGRGHLNRHRSMQTCEKRFACPTCGKAFARNSQLERHNRTHTGEKPFPCDICGREFADPSHYRRHLKNIHGVE